MKNYGISLITERNKTPGRQRDFSQNLGFSLNIQEAKLLLFKFKIEIIRHQKFKNRVGLKIHKISIRAAAHVKNMRMIHSLSEIAFLQKTIKITCCIFRTAFGCWVFAVSRVPKLNQLAMWKDLSSLTRLAFSER